MRDYREEEKWRVAFIRERITAAHASGVVFGNSGGKDCALTGILCRRACENTLSVVMPCVSKRNYGQDAEHAALLCQRFDIRSVTVDLTQTRETLRGALSQGLRDASFPDVTDPSLQNISPRLRMTTLYAVAQSRNALVAGTGNLCERYMGYFTKWGDGGCDINPIADLNVSEIYAFLRYLEAPPEILNKPPSAGLFDGQTDEEDMRVRYCDIEQVMSGQAGEVSEEARRRIARAHENTGHKRRLPYFFGE